jgi:hypothetical protein
MSTSPDFLLVRGADLLVVGVRWSGFDLAADASNGPKLVPTASGEHVVTLFFPPQSIAEVKYTTEGDTSLRDARLAGSSRVAFVVQAGTDIPLEIPLDVVGVLEALARDGQVVSTGEGMPTAIEFPWHLTVTPQAPSGTGVVSRHAARPVVSDDGVVGLWDARLIARDGSAADAGIALVPLMQNPDDAGLDVGPPSGGQRQSIVDAGHADPPSLAHASRFGLSALGGSLSARLRSPMFEWDHDTMLGRDQRVRILETGVLYPFGHRAVYVETAERIFAPDGSHAVAGMHRKLLLLVTEPVRSTADGDLALRRQFPFGEVEILQRSFPEIPTASFKRYQRDPLPDDDLRIELQEAQKRITPLNETFSAAFFSPDVRPQTLEAFIAALRADETTPLHEAEAKAARDPDAMQSRMDEINRRIAEVIRAQHVPGLAEEAAEQLFQELQELRQQLVDEGLSEAAIAQVRSEQEFWRARVRDLLEEATRDFEATDTLHEFVAAQAAFSPDAATWVDLSTQIDDLNRRLREIATVLEEPGRDAYWTPLAGPGRPVRFPLRLAGAAGDVFLSMPLVFVVDFELSELDHFEAVHSLTDTKLAALVKAEWESVSDTGRVRLPGARIDMVRSGAAVPPPGDVHEVHALTLVAVPRNGDFWPKLTSFDVELPALRGLLPELPTRQTLNFAGAFVDGSAIPEMPLTFANPLDIDFRKVADRSGGLVSPKFFADGISRTLGPVAAAALPPPLAGARPPGLAQFDPKSVFKDATLLGFPLASLIKLPLDPQSAALDKLPKPPAIVQLFEGGIPNGMKMEWTLELEAHGPFRPKPDTKLVLSVECTLTKRETTCTVNSFELVLPPGGPADGLLTLTFGSLRFTQREGQAPDLDIKGLRVGFGGALKLLKELQTELEKVIDLPDNRPRVDVKPTGLTAGYAISAPSVKAGSFLLRNIAMHVGVDVPFDGKPVTVSLSFAKRENPFNVSVLTFGGGGYIDLTLGPDGLMRLEASMEFGAFLEVDFFVAKGEVHALGGVRFTQKGDSIDIDGFLDIGGSVEVLGLVSVSITLLVTLSYRGGNRLVGRATIVVEIDLTLFADSVEIDSGEWVLAGSERPRRDRDTEDLLIAGRRDPLDAWKRYREAFAPV